MGSNPITPTVENIEPQKSTQKTEPTEVTQKKVSYYSHLI
jgi:hypothetical protein